MSTSPKKHEPWDVESIFNPPKHLFGKGGADGDEDPARRKSPPRFLGKKRKGAYSLKSPSPQSSSTSKSDEGAVATKRGEHDEDHQFPMRSKSYEGGGVRQQEEAYQDEEDQFPIKFSLSQDYKSDASFTEYLKENLMGPSPRGSPALGPSGSFGGMFAPSPLHVQETEAFDFEPNGGGFPLPKLQMSPMSTPPRSVKRSSGDDRGDSSSCLADVRLESPPAIKRPPGMTDGGGKLPPPRLPMELRDRGLRDTAGASSSLSPRQRSMMEEDGSPIRAVLPGGHRRRHINAGGPTQHLSPGQTIYNVPSKSVGSPPSPYQSYRQYPPHPPPSPYNHPLPPASPYQPYPWRPPAPHSSRSTPQPLVSHHHGGGGGGRGGGRGVGPNEASPEFNPPRGNLRGQSRSGYRETTITVTAPEKIGSGKSDESGAGKIDPITPSPHQIRQAVSDESSSPNLAPTVHHPPARPAGHPALGGGGGGWSDSLHMAPLPPYVQAPPPQHQGGGGWGGGGQHPPAMPLPSGSGYPHHHHGSYYSPYYHQHQHHQAATHHDCPPASPGPPSSREASEWRKHHHLLHQFLLQFGHCNVPRGYGVGTHYEGLYRWCNDQRRHYQLMCRGGGGSDDEGVAEGSTMTPTRVRILTGMGFVWGHPPGEFRPPAAAAAGGGGGGGPSPSVDHSALSPSSSAAAARPYSTWDKWMELLSDYRSRHGNVDVPLKYEPNPSLGTFVNRQRTEYRKMQSGKPSSMTPERVDDLNRLDFTWAVRESHTSWEDRFAELRAFRDENGHCNVPKIYNKNPSLGYWVNEQRFQYRRLLKKKPSYMTQDKIKALNGLEFKWSLRETNGSWENWLKELREYNDQHGDVDVPLKYRHNQALGAFVNRQRTEYRKLQQGLQTSLTQERIQSLNDLGFKWAIRVSRTPWETRLDELKKFKEQHGHCNVPSTYPKNQPLAYWVFKQRGQYRIYKKRDYVMPGEKKQMCHMTPERISKLDAIGFEWNPPRRIK